MRKTITKITTLGQASVIGGIKVEELINKLRSEIGQTATDSHEAEVSNFVTEKPEWFNEANITESIDIREMLNAGEQPVHEVLSLLKTKFR